MSYRYRLKKPITWPTGTEVTIVPAPVFGWLATAVEPVWVAVGEVERIEDEVEQEACPHCDTIADEYGYCVDIGCQYLGKAVIG